MKRKLKKKCRGGTHWHVFYQLFDCFFYLTTATVKCDFAIWVLSRGEGFVTIMATSSSLELCWAVLVFWLTPESNCKNRVVLPMKVKRFTSKYHHEIIILRYPKEDIRTLTDPCSWRFHRDLQEPSALGRFWPPPSAEWSEYHYCRLKVDCRALAKAWPRVPKSTQEYLRVPQSIQMYPKVPKSS